MFKRVVFSIFFFVSFLFPQTMQINTNTQFLSPYINDWLSVPNVIQVTVFNTNTATETYYIKFELSSDDYGMILEGTSEIFTVLGGGTYTIDNTHIMDAHTKTINDDIVNQVKRTNQIPESSYTLTVNLYREGEQDPVYGPEIAVFYILSFDQIQLLSPMDGETVLNENSLIFQWTAAVQGISNFNIRYHIGVFEIKPGQIPYRVITSAYPVFEEDVINNTQLIYPASAYGRLERGKKYIWYVQAFNNNPGPNFNHVLGENEGRSAITSFFYQERTEESADLAEINRLELVPGVAFLKNLSTVSKTETATDYILDGGATLVAYIQSDSIEVPVSINGLHFQKGALYPPIFVSGDVSGSLSSVLSTLPGLEDLPIKLTDLTFTPAEGLAFSAQFDIPENDYINPQDLNGKIKLNSAGISGQLDYNGDWDNPIVHFDNELLKVHLNKIHIDIGALSARTDAEIRFLSSDSSWTFPNIQWDFPNISFPIGLTGHQHLSIIPNNDFLKLDIRSLAGTISFNAQSGAFDFDIGLTSNLLFPFTTTLSAYPEISLRLSKSNGLQLESFRPNLSQNMKLNMDWMELALRQLNVNNFSYGGGQYTFDLSMDAEFDLNNIGNLGTPVIHGIHITQNGISLEEQNFNNLSLAPFELAGLSVELKNFRVGAMQFNWANGSRPDWNFSADIDIKLPNLPMNFPSGLRNKVFHLNDLNIGSPHIYHEFSPVTFTGEEGSIPLGGGAAYIVQTLGGVLDLTWDNNSLNNQSTLTMTGNLKLPDIFGCSEAQSLGTSSLRLDGFGKISGQIENFTPTCPLKFGFLTINVTSSSLQFAFSDTAQQAILSAEVTASMPGISNSESTANGNISIDLISGKLLNGSLTFSNFALKIPDINPILTFHISSATLSKQGLEINGTQQLALAGSQIGVVFDHLLLDLKSFRVISGNAYFNSSFAFKLGIADGNLSWNAVQAGLSQLEENTMMLNLPSNLSINKNGLQLSGITTVGLNFAGQQLDSLSANFSNDFTFQFKPFKVKTGTVEFLYGGNRIAYLDEGGIHFDFNFFGNQALPDQLPLPNKSIAYMVLKENGQSLVDIQSVSNGIRISSKSGQPVRLVLPGLQFGLPSPPELGIEFSIVVDPLHFQLNDGHIRAVIPESMQGFDLSQVGIPIKISNLDYRKINGIKTFTFKGLPNLFGSVLSESDSLTLTVDESGQISSNFDINLDKSILLAGESDLVNLNLKRVYGSINCSLTGLDFNITASAGLKMKLNDAPSDVVSLDLNITPHGFTAQHLVVNSDLGNLAFNLGLVDMTLSDFTIPSLQYDKTAGWDFQFDFSANLGFPEFGSFRLPKIEHITIGKHGIHFPQTSLPDLTLPGFNMGGFQLSVTGVRIPEVTIDIFHGKFDFGSASDLRADFVLNMPNLASDMPPQLANLGLMVSDCGFRDGVITGTIQNKNISNPGIEIPIGGGAKFYAKKFKGSLSADSSNGNYSQKFEVMVEGAFQLPPGLFPCATAQDIPTALYINSDGRISGSIQNFVPSCPLSFGPVKLQVNSSSLNFDFTSGAQSAVLAMDASLKLPAPTQGDSVTANGNITLDLAKGDFIDGQIGITTPFRLNLPTDGDFLTFTINSAILNKDGLAISGGNQLNLGGGMAVNAQFENFVVGLHPLKIKSGSVTFSSSFAFKIEPGDDGLKWQAVGSNPTIDGNFGIALDLPDTLGIRDGKFYAQGTAVVSFNYNGQSYSGLSAKFRDNFKMNLWPVRVTNGKVELIRNNEMLAYIDSTGFVPGNILGALPIPDSIGLPSTSVAYMRLRDSDGNLLVETTDTGEAFMLQIKSGKTLKIKIPALSKNGNTPELNVTSLSVGVNKSTYHIVSGGIQVQAPDGASLIDLSDWGIPLDLTKFQFKKINGSYGVLLGAKIKLPESISDMDLSVDSLLLSAEGISGTVSINQVNEHYKPGTTYFKEISVGSDAPVQIKVEGLQASFSTGNFQISFSGDMYADLFKENDQAAPLHFMASVGTDSTAFSVDVSHLSNGIPLKIARMLPLANNTNIPPIKVSTAGNDFAVEVNTLLKIPQFGDDFGVEVKGLRISKNDGLHLPEIALNNPSDFMHFNLFTMQFDINQLGFFYESKNSGKVFGVNLGGQIHFMDNTSSFSGLKIGSDGSFSIAQASLISQPIDIIQDKLSLQTLEFKNDSLQAAFLVTPPQPLNQTPSTIRFMISADGHVSGGGTVVLLNEQHGLGNNDQTEWTFWKGSIDLVYMNLDLDLEHIQSSKVQINGDVWLNNESATPEYIQVGYLQGGVVHPGIQLTFNGDVNFGNFKLVGQPQFNLDVVGFKLTNLTSISGSDFGLDISGDVSLNISSVTSTVRFENLQITKEGGMPNLAASITSGSLTIADIFSLSIQSFKYEANGGDITYQSGSMPSSNSSGSKSDQTIHADRYVEFGVSMSIGDAFSGGVDRFLLFTIDNHPNIIINNLHLSIQDVVTASLDMQYLTVEGGMRFLAAGQMVVQPNIGLTTIGVFENINGKLRFGIFAAAELPGPGIVLYPGISLARLGGGFFYNPKQEYLDLVYSKTDLKDAEIINNLPKLNNGEAKFAALLYAGITIMDKTVVSGSAMITLTDQYISLAGKVMLMNMNDKLTGGFTLAARFDQFYIDGMIFAKAKLGVIKGNGQMQFKIAEDQWYVKGKMHAEIINSKFLNADSKFFIGNPGFMFQATNKSGFDFWIVSVNSTVSGTIWMKYEGPREFGAYFTYGLKAEVLMGLASISDDVKAILIVTDHFVLYGEASGEVCVCWGAKCWDGSIWVKVSNVSPKFDGGFGSDPEMQEKINEAENMADEMENEAKQAESDMEKQLVESTVLNEQQVELAGMNLYSGNPTQTMNNWINMEQNNGGLNSNEATLLATYASQDVAIPVNMRQISNQLSTLLSQEKAALNSAEAIAQSVGQQLDRSMQNLPPVDEMEGAYEMDSPIITFSDSVEVTTYTDAQGKEHQSFSVAPQLEIDDEKVNEHKDRAARMEETRQRILQQIYARIIALNIYLSQIDGVLNNDTGVNNVAKLGEQYMTAHEKLEKYFWKNHQYLYDLHNWSAGRVSVIQNKAAVLSAFIHNKANRINEIETLKNLAKGRARQLADITFTGAPDKADGLYQNLEANINQITNIDNLRQVVVNLGVNLWIEIPRSGVETLASQLDSSVAANIANRNEQVGEIETRHEQITAVIDKIYDTRIAYAQALYDLCDRYLYWQLGSAPENQIVVTESGSGGVALKSYIDANLLPGYAQTMANNSFTAGGGFSALNGTQIQGIGNIQAQAGSFKAADGVYGIGKFTSQHQPVKIKIGPDYLAELFPDVKVIHDRLALQLTSPKIENISVHTYNDNKTAHIYASYSATHPAGIANYSYAIAPNIPAPTGNSNHQPTNNGGVQTSGNTSQGNLMFSMDHSTATTSTLQFSDMLYTSLQTNGGVYSNKYKMIGNLKHLFSYFIPQTPDQQQAEYSLKIRARSTSGYVNRRIANFSLRFDGTVNNQYTGSQNMMDDSTPPIVQEISVPSYQYSVDRIMKIKVKAVDAESDVMEYAYTISNRNSLSGQNNIKWYTLGARNTFNILGLHLQHNQRYYVFVKVKNSVGMWSSPRVSRPVKIDTTAPGTVHITRTYTLPKKQNETYTLANSITMYNSSNEIQYQNSSGNYSFIIPSDNSENNSEQQNNSMFPVIGSFLFTGQFYSEQPLLPGILVQFTPADDPESGIEQYVFKVTSSAEDMNPNNGWRLLGLDDSGHPLTTIKLIGEPLTFKHNFYVHIRAINRAGLLGNTVTTIPIRPADPTEPSAPQITYGVNPQNEPFYTASSNSIILGLVPAEDKETGISAYEYKLGSTPGGSDIKNWTRNGVRVFDSKAEIGKQNFPSNLFINMALWNNTYTYNYLSPSHKRIELSGLSIPNGHTVYVTLRALNGDNKHGPSVRSKAILIDNSTPSLPLVTPYYNTSEHTISLSLFNFGDNESGLYGIKASIKVNNLTNSKKSVTKVYSVDHAFSTHASTISFPGTYSGSQTVTIKLVIVNRANLRSSVLTISKKPQNFNHVMTVQTPNIGNQIQTNMPMINTNKHF